MDITKRSKKKREGKKNRGGAGLARAREKSRKKHFKKLSNGKNLYTIKVKPDSMPDLERLPDFVLREEKNCPEKLCRWVNDRAAKGQFVKDVNKEGMIVGKLIRA